MAIFFNERFWSVQPADKLGTHKDHYLRTLKNCEDELEEMIHSYIHRHKDDPELPLEHLDSPLTLKAMIGEFTDSNENANETLTYAEWASKPENIAAALLGGVIRKVKGELECELEEQINQLTINLKELKNYGKQDF